MAKKDLLRFLFQESTDSEAADNALKDLDIEENLDRLFEAAAEAEEGELKSNKTPLAKALKEFGIDGSDLELDTDGFVLTTDNHENYTNAITVLTGAAAMHKLAEMGWVVLKSGDNAQTNEPPNYRIRFLEITQVDANDREPSTTTTGTYDNANREEVIKKAEKFAATPMDRAHDELNPIENDDGKVSKKNVGVGDDEDGKKAEHSMHGYTGKGVREGYEGKTAVCARCHSELDLPDDSNVGAKCNQCGHEGKPEYVKDRGPSMAEGALNEFTSTGSMGTAMSMGQPFVGMVKKPKPYGKGTKFKTPSQWTVHQPVVKQQVKRKVREESIEAFLSEAVPGGDEIGDIGDLGPMEPESSVEAEGEEAGNEEAYEDMRDDLQSGECALLDDSRAMSPTRIIFCGETLGVIDPQGAIKDQSEALRVIQAKMEEEQFYPNIYHINDHGNVSLLSPDGKIIQGWV
jgi:hypothetical protein